MWDSYNICIIAVTVFDDCVASFECILFLPFHMLCKLLKFLNISVTRCLIEQNDNVVFMLGNEHMLPSTRTLPQGFKLI